MVNFYVLVLYINKLRFMWMVICFRFLLIVSESILVNIEKNLFIGKEIWSFIEIEIEVIYKVERSLRNYKEIKVMRE